MMSLQIEGIPLTPNKPAVFDTATTNFEVEAVIFSNPLNIDPVYQEGKDWCWAACMSMALTRALEKPVSQCEVVLTVKPGAGPNVCSEPFVARTESCLAKEMKDAWAKFPTVSVVAHLGTTDEPNRLGFDDIVNELKQGRPLEIGFVWYINGGHAILIRGWSEDLPETVWINDPLEPTMLGGTIAGGTGLIALKVLRDGFHHGPWVHTWTGIGV